MSVFTGVGLNFGLQVKVEWKSLTGKLSDLSACSVTENIRYSDIPNPPFVSIGGGSLQESGQTRRLPSKKPLAASAGLMQDTHRHGRPLLAKPPSAGSYTVDQTYDYQCTACNSGWITFATYKITYSVSPDGAGGWVFETRKTGPGGPFVSKEQI